MVKNFISMMALLGASVTGAQAVTLDFNGTHLAANDVEYYFFTNTDVGDVQIVMDTLTDGFDATLSVWSKVAGSPVADLPEGSDWALVASSLAADKPGGPEANDSVNIYGVAVKNGYDSNSLDPTGTSDPGMDLSLLATGTYLITVNGVENDPAALSYDPLQPETTPSPFLSSGFGFPGLGGFEDFSINKFPHDYQFTVSGDFVSQVSQVPVPAAVWMMLTGLVSLGAVKRKTSAAV